MEREREGERGKERELRTRSHGCSCLCQYPSIVKPVSAANRSRLRPGASTWPGGLTAVRWAGERDGEAGESGVAGEPDVILLLIIIIIIIMMTIMMTIIIIINEIAMTINSNNNKNNNSNNDKGSLTPPDVRRPRGRRPTPRPCGSRAPWAGSSRSGASASRRPRRSP